MLPMSRITDIGIGPMCEKTFQIQGDIKTWTGNLPQTRLTDLHVWVACCGPKGSMKGGTGINITSSIVTWAGGLPVHRITDLQMGCTIATKITGDWHTFSG